MRKTVDKHTNFSQKRDSQWRDVGKLFKLAMGLSVFFGIVAEVWSNYFPWKVGMPHELARFQIYLYLMYFIATPFILYKVNSKLLGYVPPWHPLGDRILYSILGLFLFPVLILTPVIILLFGDDVVGRSHAVYLAFKGGLIGLISAGGFMFHGVSILLWLFFWCIPKMWYKSRRES